MRLEETLKERSPRAMLERACRPLAVLGRRASALAFPLKLPSGSSCDRPQGYVASPARCVRSMRFRVGPEHNNVFVIYAVDVTLAGNS